MSPRCAPGHTIDHVLREFLEDRGRNLTEENFRLYRHVIFFLELCIGNHGHRNLDEEDRARYESRSPGLEGGFHFFELFGPELLLPELDFFTDTFLKREVLTSDKVVHRAKDVVRELREWLRMKGHVSAEALEVQDDRARHRAGLKLRLRRLTRLLEKRSVSVDPSCLPEEDYVALDDHLIGRLEPGRIWLRVHRNASPEEIGPIMIPLGVSRYLRAGWTLCCALGKLRGRWHLVELEEIYPRV
ncbi:MAG: hypothetical protein ACRD3V_12355 [Vicinamibacteria bacterium]